MSIDKKIEVVDLGWEETVVMVCTKCGNQFQDSTLQDSPERIKSELKTKAKSELGKKVRVITTSCLNICPDGKIAIAKASIKGSSVFSAYAVDPNSLADELFDNILKN